MTAGYVTPVLQFQDAGRPYTCWPTKATFDAARNQDVVLYSAGASHTAADMRVFCRLRTLGGAWSNPIAVTPDAAGFTHCDGFATDPAGNYYAYTISRSGDGSSNAQFAHMRKSTDGGATWTNLGRVVKSSDGTFPVPAYGGHMMRTSTGALLTPYCSGISFNTFIFRSTTTDPCTVNNPTAIGRNNIGLPQLLSEARIFERNGELICIARRSIDSIYNVAQKAIWAKSTDDGNTWSAEWTYCTPTHHEMTNGNLDGVYDPVTDMAVLYWSSRLNKGDGYGSLYRSVVTGAQLFSGHLGEPQRIFRGHNSRDFGYPGFIHRPDGSTSLVIYDGADGDTAIYEVPCPPKDPLVDRAYALFGG